MHHSPCPTRAAPLPPLPWLLLAALGLLPLLLTAALLWVLALVGRACVCLVLFMAQALMRVLPVRLLAALTLGFGSLWLLSGCGTAPSPVWTCPPVPAALMEAPQTPVPLIPGSTSATPGSTTPSTPPAAPPTGRASAA